MKLNILGIRGLPAAHGGFETFAEKLALYLIEKGWSVNVYCQVSDSNTPSVDAWRGIKRTNIYVKGDGAVSTVIFDFKVSTQCRDKSGVNLLLGYNTAVFNIVQRLYQQPLVVNMDGIEWRRDKWGLVAKTWFWLNEKLGSYIGNHLVADHPEIKKHLSRNVKQEKITMIPYGADDVRDADISLLDIYQIQAGSYSVIIARPEPENSIFEMVQAFSSKPRNHKLVVLGNFKKDNPYHERVKNVASSEVLFVGAIYDQAVVSALRFFSRLYLHGHRVGGTNPSLVEAMGAGCAVLAHNNKFNRWVAGDGGSYFDDMEHCAELMDKLFSDDEYVNSLKKQSKARFYEKFTWEQVLQQYEELLLGYVKE
jgi:glycosyltransferase involved in cell wall biosynthesis